MGSLTAKPAAIAITLGLAATAGVLGWFLISAAGRAQGVELTSADLVPGDATLYVALNTKLDSSEWIAAFDLVERLGVDDPENELIDAVESGGDVDWDDDVAPFLGGNAAIYVRSYDFSGNTPEEFGVIIRASDVERAMEVILQELGADASETFEYEGQEYLFIPDPIDGDGYLARIGDHLVFTANEAEMERVIDVAQGREPSLKDNPEFRALHDELTKHFIGFVYVDAEALVGGLLEAGLGVFVEDEDELWQWGSSKSAMVISAKDGGFVFQSASKTQESPFSPMLQPHDDSRFTRLVPADVALFFSIQDIAGAWDGVRETWGDRLDDIVSADGEFDSLDEALEDAAAELGVENIDELVRLFNGEAAVAAWFPTPDEDDGIFALMAEVSDEARIREVLKNIDDLDVTGKETIDGVEVTLGEDEDGEEFAYAVTDGYLLVGNLEAVRKVLEANGDSLADAGRFKDAKSTLDTRLGIFGYFDFPALFEVFGGDEFVSEDDVDYRALRALLITAVEEGGFTRFSGALTVED